MHRYRGVCVLLAVPGKVQQRFMGGGGHGPFLHTCCMAGFSAAGSYVVLVALVAVSRVVGAIHQNLFVGAIFHVLNVL